MDINELVPRSINLVKKKPEWELPKFLEAEEMGIQCPRRCYCYNRTDCSISVQHLNREEQAKLRLMEQNMWVDTEQKKMVVK